MSKEPDYVQLVRVDKDDGPAEWRWRVRAGGNHEIIATSGESYVDEEHCRQMIDRLFPLLEVREP